MKQKMDKSLKIAMIAFTIIQFVAILMLIGSIYLIIKLLT